MKIKCEKSVEEIKTWRRYIGVSGVKMMEALIFNILLSERKICEDNNEVKTLTNSLYSSNSKKVGLYNM